MREALAAKAANVERLGKVRSMRAFPRPDVANDKDQRRNFQQKK
ncbi:hypothetical protein QJS83_05850 [Bdellovibrio sp. 22V]|nr:hypothetical protein [Bdellovibrio sp. 22V]WII73391.1 hypothetical protein QJS83_05850 [Bdellovibrio sp. 22V]